MGKLRVTGQARGGMGRLPVTTKACRNLKEINMGR